MKKEFLLLSLLLIVSCSEGFEDEYLLCKSNFDSDAYHPMKSMLKYEETGAKYKHTEDNLVLMENSSGKLEEFPFVEEDESGYRYFRRHHTQKDGTVILDSNYKYHPIFGDISYSLEFNVDGTPDISFTGKCTKVR
jgi:hypothetical protein